MPVASQIKDQGGHNFLDSIYFAAKMAAAKD